MNPSSATRVITILPILAIFATTMILLFRRYAGLAGMHAVIAAFASTFAGGVQIFQRSEATRRLMNHSNETQLIAGNISAGVFIVLLTAFLFRMWTRWIGGKATAEECMPGAAGVRAWFSASNVIMGVLLVVTAWLGYDVSPLLGIVGVCTLLAAYPILRMESAAPASPAPTHEDLSTEREKIVSMLEAGKLTPEESAELLQALGESSRAAAPAARQIPLTGGQRLVLIGAALVAFGFFLPWFVINPGKEASRMMSEAGVNLHLQMPSMSFGPLTMNANELKTPTVQYSGGDIQRGLGWATLALALAAALIPYVATAMDAATARTVRLLCLGVGALIVLYLLTQNIRFIGIGLIIAVTGYILEIAGAMRDRNPAGA